MRPCDVDLVWAVARSALAPEASRPAFVIIFVALLAEFRKAPTSPKSLTPPPPQEVLPGALNLKCLNPKPCKPQTRQGGRLSFALAGQHCRSSHAGLGVPHPLVHRGAKVSLFQWQQGFKLFESIWCVEFLLSRAGNLGRGGNLLEAWESPAKPCAGSES